MFLLEQNGHTGCSSARTKPQAATVTFSKELRTTNRQSKKLSKQKIKQKQCHHLLSRKQLSSIGILLERGRSKMHQDDFPQWFCLQHATSQLMLLLTTISFLNALCKTVSTYTNMLLEKAHQTKAHSDKKSILTPPPPNTD